MKNLYAHMLNVKVQPPGLLHAGRLLVSEPLLREEYFTHSVVMIVDYTPCDGSLGLVMNQSTGHTLDEYIDGVDPARAPEVFCGGPIAHDRIVFMHTLGPEFFEGAKEFAPGLYLGGDFNSAIDYLNDGYPTEGLLRFFVGYSGWDSTQLDSELEAGVWAMAYANADRSALLRGEGEAYWHRAVRSMGENYRAWRLFPRNLLAN